MSTEEYDGPYASYEEYKAATVEFMTKGLKDYDETYADRHPFDYEGPEMEVCQPDDQDQEEGPKIVYLPGTVWVNVYEVNRLYGGPEEGGWWFPAGEILASHQVPESLAEGYAAMIKAEWPSHGNSNSVNYRGGDFRVRIQDGPGEDYPKVHPHYE